MSVQDIRKQFPMLARKVDGKNLVYLDSAATTLKPQSVIDAVTAYYTEFTANIHRGRHRISEEASDHFEAARCKLAVFAGCASNEVIFVRNTTEALNLAAHCLELRASDLVVGFLDAHHSQLLPWMARATYRAVAHGDDWRPDMEHYRALLRQRPKAVVITQCSNVTGAYLPVAEIARLAREAGAFVVVDAAQSAGHRQLDFSRLDVDFLAFSAHKLLGPSGIGCLVGRANLLAKAKPFHYGGGIVDFTTLESYQLRKIPHSLEAGTPAIEAACGFAAAIDFLEVLGWDAVAAHDQLMIDTFLAELKTRPGWKLLGPTDGADRTSIFSLYFDGIPDLSDVCRALSDSHGVMCRNGHLCAQPIVDRYTDGEVIRLSAYLYNTPDELRFAMDSLEEIIVAFRS